MEPERVSASTMINAAPEAVFGVLADPSAHADIDGTGWVRESLDDDRITGAGQVFRTAMFHENHPDKDYKIANRVEVFDEPRAIAWQPGTESPETGELSFGGWISSRSQPSRLATRRQSETLDCSMLRRLGPGRAHSGRTRTPTHGPRRLPSCSRWSRTRRWSTATGGSGGWHRPCFSS
jgi:hypothetical protein